jgi:hypothetical protein
MPGDTGGLLLLLEVEVLKAAFAFLPFASGGAGTLPGATPSMIDRQVTTDRWGGRIVVSLYRCIVR